MKKENLTEPKRYCSRCGSKLEMWIEPWCGLFDDASQKFSVENGKFLWEWAGRCPNHRWYDWHDKKSYGWSPFTI